MNSLSIVGRLSLLQSVHYQRLHCPSLYHRCCRATENLPATCTNPLTQFQEPSRTNLCPAPPRLSYDDITTGALDSHLVFVDEHLINRAKYLDPEVFIRRVLGGFVMMNKEPNFGSCGGYPNKDFVETLQGKVETQFLQCNGMEYFALNGSEINLRRFPWLERDCPTDYEGGSGGNGGGSGGNRGDIDGGSLVDGTSANIFQQTVCNLTGELKARNSTPVFTPNNPPQPNISATVYYNNNVSGNK